MEAADDVAGLPGAFGVAALSSAAILTVRAEDGRAGLPEEGCREGEYLQEQQGHRHEGVRAGLLEEGCRDGEYLAGGTCWQKGTSMKVSAPG